MWWKTGKGCGGRLLKVVVEDWQRMWLKTGKGCGGRLVKDVVDDC